VREGTPAHSAGRAGACAWAHSRTAPVEQGLARGHTRAHRRSSRGLLARGHTRAQRRSSRGLLACGHTRAQRRSSRGLRVGTLAHSAGRAGACAWAHSRTSPVEQGLARGHTRAQRRSSRGLRVGTLAHSAGRAGACAWAHSRTSPVEQGLARGHTRAQRRSSRGLRVGTLAHSGGWVGLAGERLFYPKEALGLKSSRTQMRSFIEQMCDKFESRNFSFVCVKKAFQCPYLLVCLQNCLWLCTCDCVPLFQTDFCLMIVSNR
jgi:hypothetical protein